LKTGKPSLLRVIVSLVAGLASGALTFREAAAESACLAFLGQSPTQVAPGSVLQFQAQCCDTSASAVPALGSFVWILAPLLLIAGYVAHRRQGTSRLTWLLVLATPALPLTAHALSCTTSLTWTAVSSSEQFQGAGQIFRFTPTRTGRFTVTLASGAQRVTRTVDVVGNLCTTPSARPARGQYAMVVGATPRNYYLVPASIDGPVPLVLEFHGLNGSGQMIIPEFGLDTSLGGKAVIIGPDGSNQGGDIGWGSGNSNPDIDFTRALIAKAQQENCIDSSRIYAIGASWGGWMASQLACALGPQLRTFVSVAGGGPTGGGCIGAVPGMIVHGVADDVEPIASGISTRDQFRVIDACTGPLGTASVAGCQAYSGCIKPLLWCQHNGGHITPQFLKDGLPGYLASLP
jgi:poly(3-hydroxybutyrate) depolymerase